MAQTRKLPVAVLCLMLAACQTRMPYGDDVAPVRNYIAIATPEAGQRQFIVHDPVEGFNKQVYKFNARLDDYVLIPIVNGYKYIVPEVIRGGVSNFFLNVGEVTNFTNAALQASPKKASKTLGRFVVNTTAGLLGTVDVATKIGLARQPEDFGQTLGKWGYGPGPYLVLPLVGPSNVRDAAGRIVDLVALSALIPNNIEGETGYKVVTYGVLPVDARYRNNFRYFNSGSPFEYELVRFINTQARKAEIEK